MIRSGGEKESGKSVLSAWFDDDDDYYLYIYIYIYNSVAINKCGLSFWAGVLPFYIFVLSSFYEKWKPISN